MAKTIREAREEQKLTQFDLAVRSGLSLATVRNAEKGRGSPRTVVTLSKLLGIKIDWKGIEQNLSRGTTRQIDRNAKVVEQITASLDSLEAAR